MKLFIFQIFLFQFFSVIQRCCTSAGDYSKYYVNCMRDCEKNVCKMGRLIPVDQPWAIWSCRENCQYECQWDTVGAFRSRQLDIPKFYGKWPFIRILGLQEPASTIFSLFNLAVVVQQLRKFRDKVRSDAPYYTMWQIYSALCINGWAWSAIYHTRDSDTTEKMDYIAASLMVFTAFFTMTMRLFHANISIKSCIWAVLCFSVITNHIAYLWLFKFDYGYNMTFNVIVGALTIIGYLTLAAKEKNHPRRKTIVVYCFFIIVSTMLELGDFPPFLWIFDAHALWHLATGLITPLFYDFIIYDCLYLQQQYSPSLIPRKMD